MEMDKEEIRNAFKEWCKNAGVTELPTGPDTTENIQEIMNDEDTPGERKPINMHEQQHPEAHERKMPLQDGKMNYYNPDTRDNENTTAPDPRKLVITYGRILETMADIHKRKNSDYGDAAHQGYKKYGIVYYLVQLHNKLTRLESLTLGNKEVKVNESIDDTLMDLANYAVMALESLHRND